MWTSTINWLFGYADALEEEAAVQENPTVEEAKELQWIFLGVGESSWNLAECINSSTTCKLGGVIAADRSPAPQFVSQFGVPFWKKEEARSWLTSFDIAFVSGPVAERSDLCTLALESGCHVLVESPFYHNREEAEFVCEKAARQNRFFMEVHPGSFCPGITKLMEVVRNRVIGKISMISLNYSPPKFEESSTPQGSGVFFLQQITWALKFMNKVYSADKPLHLSVLGESLESKSQVVLQAKYRGCQMSAVTLSSVVQLPGSATLHGPAGTVTIPYPWWQPESFTLHRSAQADVVETDLHGSPVKTMAVDAESSVEWSESPDRAELRYVWSRDQIKPKTGQDGRTGLGGDRLTWSVSSRSSSERSQLPHTSSRISDDGSLRGWVNDLNDSASADNMSVHGISLDVDDAELDLGQAALAAASAMSPEHSDSEDGANVVRWMAEHGSTSLSSGRVKSRKGNFPPLWSPSNWPSRKVDRLQYEVNQMKLVMEEVMRCIEAGLLESPEAPISSSLALASTLDDVLSQLGYGSLMHSASSISVNRNDL